MFDVDRDKLWDEIMKRRTFHFEAMSVPHVTVYTDYKSPYAYLAKDLAYELERDLGGAAGVAAVCAGHPELSSAPRASMLTARCWRRTATHISGVASATATWIADVRRANAAW